MRTLAEIHDDIERASELRAALRHRLAQGHDPSIVAELNGLDERLDALWQEQRTLRATLQWGERDKIVARARAEERLERNAA